MANHIGNEGTVEIGANTVAEIVSFSLNVSGNTAEDTALGDVWASHVAGTKSWSGSINCYWDETDTNGQGALAVGATVVVHLMPEGTTTGDWDFTGSAIVTVIEYSVSQDVITTANFTFTGTGALTSAAQGA